MRITILFITFFFVSINLIARTIKVDYGFGVDISQKMIVVNQDISSLNNQQEGIVSSILIDNNIYYFENEINELSIGTAYWVKNKAEVSYTLYFTPLPLLHITTKEEIVKDEKVLAEFTITESNSKTISSPIGIKIRGGVSIWFPKKSYRIEFWADKEGTNTADVSLLDMRSDDDWNIQAMYTEQLRITNKVSFDIWKRINTLYYQHLEKNAINGSRWEYGELFLNDKYQGVYGVSEPVDRKQLKLKKYNEKEGIQGELYRGECTCCYNPTNLLPEYGNPVWENMFKYDYPKEIPADWNNLMTFRKFISESTENDFLNNYKLYFNVENAVDYFIFLNLLRANDNKGKNLYLAKYKANEPYFFVPWDLDAVFGAGWDGNPIDITDDILTNYFYDRLLRDYTSDGFRIKVKKRWGELRKSWVNVNEIVKMFYEKHDYLQEIGIYEREEKVWGYDYEYDPQNRFDYLSSWLTRRIKFLDSKFEFFGSGIDDVKPDYKGPWGEIQIFNLSGQMIKTFNNILFNEEMILSSGLIKGIYIFKMKNVYLVESKKVIIN